MKYTYTIQLFKYFITEPTQECSSNNGFLQTIRWCAETAPLKRAQAPRRKRAAGYTAIFLRLKLELVMHCDVIRCLISDRLKNRFDIFGLNKISCRYVDGAAEEGTI